MLLQEIYNHKHKLSDVPLGIRVGYILPAFFLVFLAGSNAFNGIVIVFFLTLSKIVTRLTYKQLFRLYKFPVLFLLIGCITIAFSFNSDKPFFSIYGVEFGFDTINIILAIEISFRSVAILSVVFFGLLIHTISEISQVLFSIKIPRLFIELFVLTYKFIFNLSSLAKSMYTAQRLRLAYIKQGNNRQAFATLFSAVFRRAIQKSYHLGIAIDLRLGSGDFYFLSRQNTFKKRQVFVPLMLSVILIVLYVILQSYG